MMGDAIIAFSENLDYDKLHMNVATGFIEYLYVLLTQDENETNLESNTEQSP